MEGKMKYTINVYEVDRNGFTKLLCWNEYNSEWLGLAYMRAWWKRVPYKKIIAHVVNNKTGYSRNLISV